MTNPGLCVTITADTTAELRAARDRVTDADLIELRLDTVRDPDVAAALEGRRRPVIVTCRAAWEGGQFRGSETEREALLATALALGAEYVDVEFRAGFSRLLMSAADRIVLSSHDFEALPTDLETRARAMHATGAAVVKIAAKASRLTDCLTLMDLGKAFGRDRRQVVIGMGDAGLASRVLPGRFHSAWTYAGALSGIGQLTAETLLHQYRFRSLDSDSTIFGLTGFPIGHSVSPAMHNAACANTGVNGVYLPMPAATADEFLDFANAMGVAGASITIPHKVTLFERADVVDDTARAIGAINTLKRDGQRWVGMNSDLPGFMQPLEARGVSLKGKRVAVLGAGGAARAVALGAAAAGGDVAVYARDVEKARPVAALAKGRTAAFPPDAESWDVLVNCTPIGMHPNVDASPIELAPRTSVRDPRHAKIVYDLIYNPLETRLLRDARMLGYATIGGLDMLVAQAIAQFRWWTGHDPEATPMHAAAMARLAEFNHP